MAVTACLVSRGIDQRSADTLSPFARLDEEAVKLGESVVALDHREAGNAAVDLRDRDFATLNECNRELDRIGMRLEMRPVLRIRQRGSPLQIVEKLSFGCPRWPEADLSAH